MLLFMALIGLAALILLSAALRDFTFKPPLPFSFDLSSFSGLGFSGSGISIPAWRYFLFGGLVLVILAIILLVVDPELRKRILYRLLRLGLALLLIWFIFTHTRERDTFDQLLNMPQAVGLAAPPVAPEAGGPVYVPPQINPWVVFAVSFGIGLMVVLVAWFLYTRQLKARSGLVKEEVAGIAREALAGLQPGGNWEDAIVRAYVRMNEVVNAERGLVRQPGNTPAEFARSMERMGLPGEAVRTLTGLFEMVRYGAKTSSPADRDLAAAALSAILHYCGVNA